ncbi:MAG: hypothetical protein QMC81_11450 [Thermoanaerobacterales bacterium]|nr:hypothetical protein [Thermoanaerobacterales bacterium]MDQ7791228.1 hypothetical protein [Clostridia bacterium]
MAREHKPTRSGYPRDLRDAGPAGEVKTTWQPEAFTWYGEEARAKGGGNTLFIYIGKSQMRVSSAAALAAGMKAGDRVQIGVNKQFLALKKSGTGVPANSDRGKTSTHGLLISATQLIRKLAGDGWPVPCRALCVFDEQNAMLVARKPGGGLS